MVSLSHLRQENRRDIGQFEPLFRLESLGVHQHLLHLIFEGPLQILVPTNQLDEHLENDVEERNDLTKIQKCEMGFREFAQTIQ